MQQLVSNINTSHTRLNVEKIHNAHRGFLKHALAIKGIPAHRLEDAYQNLMLSSLEKANKFDPSKGASELTRVAHYHLRAVASKEQYHMSRDARSMVYFHRTAGDDDETDDSLETSHEGVEKDAHRDPELRTQLVLYTESLFKALTTSETAVMDNLGFDLLRGQLAGTDVATAAMDLDSTSTTVRRHVCNIRAKARQLWAQHFDVDLTKPVEERIVITH